MHGGTHTNRRAHNAWRCRHFGVWRQRLPVQRCSEQAGASYARLQVGSNGLQRCHRGSFRGGTAVSLLAAGCVGALVGVWLPLDIAWYQNGSNWGVLSISKAFQCIHPLLVWCWCREAPRLNRSADDSIVASRMLARVRGRPNEHGPFSCSLCCWRSTTLSELFMMHSLDMQRAVNRVCGCVRSFRVRGRLFWVTLSRVCSLIRSVTGIKMVRDTFEQGPVTYLAPWTVAYGQASTFLHSLRFACFNQPFFKISLFLFQGNWRAHQSAPAGWTTIRIDVVAWYYVQKHMTAPRWTCHVKSSESTPAETKIVLSCRPSAMQRSTAACASHDVCSQRLPSLLFAWKSVPDSDCVHRGDRFDWKVRCRFAKRKRRRIEFGYTVSRPRFSLVLRVPRWKTSRPTNPLSNGSLCACVCTRKRIRWAAGPAEAHDRAVPHRAPMRKRETRRALGTCPGHVSSDEASARAAQGAGQRRSIFGRRSRAPDSSHVSRVQLAHRGSTQRSWAP